MTGARGRPCHKCVVPVHAVRVQLRAPRMLRNQLPMCASWEQLTSALQETLLSVSRLFCHCPSKWLREYSPIRGHSTPGRVTELSPVRDSPGPLEDGSVSGIDQSEMHSTQFCWGSPVGSSFSWSHNTCRMIHFLFAFPSSFVYLVHSPVYPLGRLTNKLPQRNPCLPISFWKIIQAKMYTTI